MKTSSEEIFSLDFLEEVEGDVEESVVALIFSYDIVSIWLQSFQGVTNPSNSIYLLNALFAVEREQKEAAPPPVAVVRAKERYVCANK